MLIDSTQTKSYLRQNTQYSQKIESAGSSVGSGIVRGAEHIGHAMRWCVTHVTLTTYTHAHPHSNGGPTTAV